MSWLAGNVYPQRYPLPAFAVSAGHSPAGMQSTRQLILQLAAQGKTVFLSSHLLFEIQLLCNRAAVLHRGRLLRQGTIQDFLQVERIVVRMATPQQAEKALAILRSIDHAWIRQISGGDDTWHRQVIFVETSLERSSEIANILARYGLYAVELYHYQASLEEFFLDLTTTVH